MGNKWNVGIVAKIATLVDIEKKLKKKNENDLANVVTEEVQNTLLLQWIVQLIIEFWTQKPCFIPLHQ